MNVLALVLVLLAAIPLANAQDAAKTLRVGVLLSGSSTQWSTFEDALVDGLRERGYVEGKNLVIVRRYGELNGTRIRNSAADLATMQLDSIVTSCTGTTRSAASAAPTTPIIMAALGDPVAAGLVASLAHPGGNITGRASSSTGLTGKRLSLLRDDPVMIENRARIAEAAIRLKLPSISSPRIYADAGGLMSCGMDTRDDFKLSAAYVVKVGTGANPPTCPSNCRRSPNSRSTCARPTRSA
jgi:ABC-type uncharacterized transport system substrate-binding protein